MMPYMMNFDLKKVAELNKKGLKNYEKSKESNKNNKVVRLVLDSDDILILRFIYKIGQEPKSLRDKEDNSFFWVKYDALFAEYEGLLLISKSALNKRLNKYADMKLIERKCVKNEDGSFSFFKLTGINDLIYIPVDSNNQKPIDNQIHFSEVIREDEEIVENEEVDEEAKADYELRVELIEQVLSTKASKELKSQLANFKDQYDFFNYFDNFIFPQKKEGKKNTCGYMVKNIKMYLNGEL